MVHSMILSNGRHSKNWSQATAEGCSQQDMASFVISHSGNHLAEPRWQWPSTLQSIAQRLDAQASRAGGRRGLRGGFGTIMGVDAG